VDTLSILRDVELDDEVAVLLVEFQPALQFLLLAGFFYICASFIAVPAGNLLDFALVKLVQVEPLREAPAQIGSFDLLLLFGGVWVGQQLPAFSWGLSGRLRKMRVVSGWSGEYF
jgi:hypothetical protein